MCIGLQERILSQQSAQTYAQYEASAWLENQPKIAGDWQKQALPRVHLTQTLKHGGSPASTVEHHSCPVHLATVRCGRRKALCGG